MSNTNDSKPKTDVSNTPLNMPNTNVSNTSKTINSNIPKTDVSNASKADDFDDLDDLPAPVPNSSNFLSININSWPTHPLLRANRNGKYQLPFSSHILKKMRKKDASNEY